MLAWSRSALALVAVVAYLSGHSPIATVRLPQDEFGRRPASARNPARPSTDLIPFAFGTPPNQPGRQRRTPSSGRYLADWLKAVESHQPGGADAPLRLISTWSRAQLWDTVVGFETLGTALLLSQFEVADKAVVLKRAVLLHSDIGLLAMASGRAPDAVAEYQAASLQFGAALDLVEWFRREAPRNDPFVHDWYRMLAAFLVSTYEIGSTPGFMEWAVERFGDDPDLLLLAGGTHEQLASPSVQESPDTRGINRTLTGAGLGWGTADDNLEAAEYFYRQALRRRPSMTEARVRLGRVLGQQGRHQQALAELTRALAETPPAPLSYYLQLFIGQEEEAMNGAAAARTAYRRAIEMRPDAGFAYLALSRLERTAGSRPAAAEAVQQMLLALAGSESAPDLWAQYYAAGEARRASALVEAFRDPFRRRQ